MAEWKAGARGVQRDNRGVGPSAWYARPNAHTVELDESPRLASWNKSSDPDQVKLAAYLEHAAGRIGPARPLEPWALWLDVGLPSTRDLLKSADLDNYALPLARRVGDQRLVSVWCTKRHADRSAITVGPAHPRMQPAGSIQVRTSGSWEGPGVKEQIRAAVTRPTALPDGAVSLEISFAVGPSRNWHNLWKPAIDSLDPILGRTRDDKSWHPRDDRITELGLHVITDAGLGYDTVLTIAAKPAGT